jgi:YggT family protein
MGSSYLASPLLLIINTLFDLYIMLVLLRFLFQMLRSNFYNPISQFVVRATTPPLKPLRRIIPGFAGQDMAAIVLSLLLLMVKYFLVRSLGAGALDIANVLTPIASISIGGLVIVAIAEILATFINIFLFAIIIQVILSWVNPGSYNPITALLYSISSPVMKPIQRFIPAMGGLDLSPLFATLALMVIKMLLIPPVIYLATQL